MVAVKKGGNVRVLFGRISTRSRNLELTDFRALVSSAPAQLEVLYHFEMVEGVVGQRIKTLRSVGGGEIQTTWWPRSYRALA